MPTLPGNAQALLDAVIAISSDLDIHSVLTRIVEAAAELTQAQYAALGVIGSDGELSDFITTGLDAHEREMIGELPRGRGILRLLIDQPEAIRLEELQAHPESYGFPPNHPPMRSFLGVPVRIRGTVFGNLYLTQKADEQLFTEQDQELVGALAAAAGFVIDNARAYSLSERRRQWLEASAELTEALQPPVELADALHQISHSARAVSGARATGILGPAHAAQQRNVAADHDDLALVGRVLDTVERTLVDRPDADGWRVVEGMSAVVIPLRAHLVRGGVLVALFDHGHGPLEFEEGELLASFADQAALALDRAQAVADREQLAVISDRERIARDLHDVVIQRLFATGLQLQAVQSVAGSAEVIGRIDKAVDDLDLTIKDIRGSIFELQSRATDSLRGAVRTLAKEYVAVLGFEPTVRTTGPLDTAVSTEVRDHLLAVLREALSNVARHAAADRAEVEIRVTDTHLSLTVSDDGAGLPPNVSESGLRNARRRAEDLGGDLELTAGEPHGTRLAWQVPLS